MAIDPLQTLRGAAAVGATTPRAPAGASGGGGFGDVLAGKLGEVEKLQREADAEIQALGASGGEGLQDAVVSMEKAALSFELMMRVRSKIVEAYQEVMRMQV
jgi:flagellar hook-basal body complex protein FliE